VALVVQKYGGTSVGDMDRLRNVARRCLRARDAGDRVVVVVSAMAGETNRLLELTRKVARRPDEREQDVVVATGEQVSVGLLALAIQDQGGRARSYLGHQVRILTDSAFSRARIKAIDAQKVFEALDRGEIAVVAGFQGVDDDGNVTTLGRGGSDTTAVAVAAALKADSCEIYTDVDGVYTADPNLCPGARKLERVSYEEMLELASLGSKVLQIRSVLFAMRYRVPLWVKSSFTDDPGTLIAEEDTRMEAPVVTGIAHDRDQAKIALRSVPDRPGVAASIFKPLADAQVSVDMIVQNVSHDGTTDLTFTVARGDLARAREVMQEMLAKTGAKGVETDDDVSKVSIVGAGMRNHAGVAAQMFETLAKEGVNIQMISTSEIKVSCVIQAKYTELAVRSLHAAFGLDAAPGGVDAG
jgi:aspartate kinase